MAHRAPLAVLGVLLCATFTRSLHLLPEIQARTHVANYATPDYSLDRVSTGISGKLKGTFVAACELSSWFPGVLINITAATTTQYNDDGTFESDHTEYEGNSCFPGQGKLFAKINIRGIVRYHGANRIIPDATLTEWIHNSSLWYFPTIAGDTSISNVVARLNQECPCGGTWATGVWRNVTGGQCGPVRPTTYYLCQLMAGKTGYGNYRWLSDAPRTYIASPLIFDPVIGYGTAPISSPRVQIPESGATDPTDCTYLQWAQCGTGVTLAGQNCNGCVSLDCTGCLYRDINGSTALFNECCPCFYFYAQRYDTPWMQIKC